MKIESVTELNEILENGPYVPGGYPLYFIMADGEALSFKAIADNRELVVEAIEDDYRMGQNQWLPVAYAINWEDTELYCDHTGERIESAYGDE